MKAFKGFDQNMQCRGFQFKEGETFHEEKADLCHCGFHACEVPLDVFNYYAPGMGSIYREVELEDVCDNRRSDDSKVCAKTIKIGAEIGIPGIVKAQIEWVKKTIGFDEAIKKAGESPDEHATGYQGAASATGTRGAASATGDQGAASATGTSGAASATGKDSVALAAGKDGKVKGALGCAIFAVERGDWNGGTYPILAVAAAIVDGKTIKADTWYRLVNGEFKEVVDK